MSLYNKQTRKWEGNKHIIVYAARPSNGCRTIANALRSRRWYETSGRGPRVGNKLLVNWGSRLMPDWRINLKANFSWLNSPEHVDKAIDKIRFFDTLKVAGLSEYAVAYTTDIAVGRAWQNDGRRVVERRLLDSHSGQGITIREPGDPVREAPLYTRYYAKTHELRFHVFRGTVIDIAEKRRRTLDPGQVPDDLIRVGSRGWVYSHRLSARPSYLRELGTHCCKALGALQLDFGAVDVLCKLAEGEDGDRRVRGFKICEVNTAPGLENTSTIEAYQKAINDLYNSGAK